MQDDEDPYNGKVLLAAVICLSAVVIFVILLHSYGRWLLRRGELHLPQRRSSAPDPEFYVRVHGMDAKAVAALPEFVYRAAERPGRNEDCAVCLNRMDDGERGRILPGCGHVFHAGCIDTWLAAQCTCPICRAMVAAEETGEEAAAVEEAGDVEMSISSSPTETAEEVVVGETGSGAGSPAGCSVKRMLSRSRSDKRVFPTAVERVYVVEGVNGMFNEVS